MKLFLLLAVLIAISSTSSTYAQKSIKITVSGISDELQAKLQPNEMISSIGVLNNDLGDVPYTIKVEGKNPWKSESRTSYSSDIILPNKDGKYDFSAEVDFVLWEPGSANSIDTKKQVSLIISIPTNYGNTLWTEVTVEPGDWSKPFTLDNYSGHLPRKELVANKEMTMRFNAPTEWGEFMEDIHDDGDSLKKPSTLEDFTLQIKNVGSEDWQVNGTSSACKLDWTTTSFTYTVDQSKFDFTKNFIIRVAAKTKNGNYIWNGAELRPWEIGNRMNLDAGYGPTAFDGLTIESRPYVDESAEEEENSQEDEEESSDATESSTTETTTTSGGTTNTGSTSTTTTGTTTSSGTDNSSSSTTTTDETATETTTKSQSCDPSDTTLKTIAIYQENICVRGIKYNLKGKSEGTLFADADVTINGAQVPLKGGVKVLFDAERKVLGDAVLREDAEFKQGDSEFTMKAGKVKFGREGLLGANLTGEGSLSVNGTDFGCQAGTQSKGFDIEFDNKGRLKTFTSVKQGVISANTSITVPSKSRFSMKNGGLYAITLAEKTRVKIGDQEFSVVPDNQASLIFSSIDVLESFIVGSGHSIQVQGQEIKLQSNSRISLAYSGAYSFTKVFTAETVTVQVTKKGKTKEVEVKAGKKIVIENGVVVKAG